MRVFRTRYPATEKELPQGTEVAGRHPYRRTIFARFGRILAFCFQNEEKVSFSLQSIDSNFNSSCLIPVIFLGKGQSSAVIPHFSRNNFIFDSPVDVVPLDEGIIRNCGRR